MTAQPRALCEYDVDRNFVLPAMIAADAIGYYARRAARAEAFSNLTRKYDLASFHDQGLRFGPLPLSLLRLVLFSKHPGTRLAKVESWQSTRG